MLLCGRSQNCNFNAPSLNFALFWLYCSMASEQQKSSAFQCGPRRESPPMEKPPPDRAMQLLPWRRVLDFSTKFTPHEPTEAATVQPLLLWVSLPDLPQEERVRGARLKLWIFSIHAAYPPPPPQRTPPSMEADIKHSQPEVAPALRLSCSRQRSRYSRLT